MSFFAIVIGLYLVLPTGLLLLARVARSRRERRTAEVLLGWAAWLVVAPGLALWLGSPEVHTIEHPVFIQYSWDEPGIIDDTGLACLIAFAITAPLFLVPIARALLRRRRFGATEAPA